MSRKNRRCYDDICTCSEIMRQNRPIQQLPESGLVGIYAIKERRGSEIDVIYVGKSEGHVRQRLLSHLNGYDGQEIGRYLSLKNKTEMENIYIAWVETKSPGELEHNTIRCVESLQGRESEFNLIKGNSK